MAKSNTPILDGMIIALIALDKLNKRKRPTIKKSITKRQVYDHKKGKVITLTTTNETLTQEL